MIFCDVVPVARFFCFVLTFFMNAFLCHVDTTTIVLLCICVTAIMSIIDQVYINPYSSYVRT